MPIKSQDVSNRAMFGSRPLPNLLAALAILSSGTTAIAEPVQHLVRPSETDPSVTASDLPHVVVIDGFEQTGPLLVWMTGTGGTPAQGEWPFFNTALANGYRVIALSYIDTPAVAMVCINQALLADRHCSEHFREKRAFGKNATDVISDAPQDAIVHRLKALLVFLTKSNPRQHWDAYLHDGEPDWSKMVLSGQSQGGGMAAFIAQRFEVAGVIDFSGGWDHATTHRLADWYSQPNATPPERWYGTYNAKEDAAAEIAASYAALRIPVGHRFKLDRQSLAAPHGAGAVDPIYKDIWIKMLLNKD